MEGIYLRNTNYMEVNWNRVEWNAGSGIMLRGAHGATVSANEVVNNTRDGIHFLDVDYSRAESNYAVDNAVDFRTGISSTNNTVQTTSSRSCATTRARGRPKLPIGAHGSPA
jgi:parallel beta-helix repeat protein